MQVYIGKAVGGERLLALETQASDICSLALREKKEKSAPILLLRMYCVRRKYQSIFDLQHTHDVILFDCNAPGRRSVLCFQGLDVQTGRCYPTAFIAHRTHATFSPEPCVGTVHC